MAVHVSKIGGLLPGSRASAPRSRIGVEGFGYLSGLRKIASLMAEAVHVDILLRGDPYCVIGSLRRRRCFQRWWPLLLAVYLMFFCLLMIWVVIPFFSVMYLADMLIQLQYCKFFGYVIM